MLLFETPLVLGILCVIIALHIASYFTPEHKAKMLTYVNIALHIFLMFSLIFCGFKIDESVLIYMISLFCFVGCRFIGETVRRREDSSDDV